MTLNTPPEGLYNFFIIGLRWLREDTPDILARRGASVFSAYENGSSAFKTAKTYALQSWDLADLLRERSSILKVAKQPSKRELQRLVEESSSHNVILTVPQEDLSPNMLFGPRGCHHVITEAGITYARSVMSILSGVITKEEFLRGWESHKAQMAMINAKKDA